MRDPAHPGPSLVQEPLSSLPSTTVAGRVLLTVEAEHLLPQAYLEGFANDPHSLLNDFSSGPASRSLAQWFVVPRNLSISCTVGFVFISLLSLAGIVLAFPRNRHGIVFLLVPVVLFMAGFTLASWNGGVRHMLPMFLFLIILAAAGCLELAKHLQWVKYASVVTSKPAMRGRLKTGHGEWPETGFVLPRRRWFGKAGFDFSCVLS